MGLFSNKIDKASLKPGDHICSWRTAYIYAHHGWRETGRILPDMAKKQAPGTPLDGLLASSVPANCQVDCPTCTGGQSDNGIFLSCLSCFLAGSVLYRFEYAAYTTLFLAKVRGGTCTLAPSDPDVIVVHRAKCLLDHGFGCYNVFKNNCENFAVYCKTGPIVVDQGTMGQSAQALCMFRGSLAGALSTALRLVTNIYGVAANEAMFYRLSRCLADIGVRTDVMKVSVEDLISCIECMWSSSHCT